MPKKCNNEEPGGADMKEFILIVKNEMNVGDKDRQVYVYIKSYENWNEFFVPYGEQRAITLPCGASENNYLEVSLTHGPGELDRVCFVDLPLNRSLDYTFIPGASDQREVTTKIEFRGEEGKERQKLIYAIPEGPPNWSIKITCSTIESGGGYVIQADGEDVAPGPPEPRTIRFKIQ